MCGHESAVAQDNNAIGDARDLFEPVANVDKADPLFSELVNLREQSIRFLAAESRGWLIQN